MIPHPPRVPSNTYTLAERGIIGCVTLAFLAVGVAILGSPEALATVCGLFGTLGMSIGALGSLGAGALAYKDAASGGLTGSMGHRVLEARQVPGTTTSIQAVVAAVAPAPSPEEAA